MAKPGFQILEHPSEIGVEGTGATAGEAFAQVARGMISILVDPHSVDASEEREITLEATDRSHLLVRWLSEVLFLFDGEGFVMNDCRIPVCTATHLRATLRGEAWQPGKHVPGLEVKAVTYHQLHIEDRSGAWRVRVFFDI